LSGECRVDVITSSQTFLSQRKTQYFLWASNFSQKTLLYTSR